MVVDNKYIWEVVTFYTES